MPTTFFRLNMETLNLERFWQNKELVDKTGYNEDEFVSDLTHFKSKDGTSVPITIIRKKSILPSLDTPPAKPILTHLYGYGGFGTSNKPEFSIKDTLFYKNMEGIQVIAHTRGGGELG
jgi:prolyl oligopeptidase